MAIPSLDTPEASVIHSHEKKENMCTLASEWYVQYAADRASLETENKSPRCTKTRRTDLLLELCIMDEPAKRAPAKVRRQ